VRDESKIYTFTGSGWADLSAAPGSVGIGGGLPNATDGFILKSPAALLNNAGAGHVLKVNKNASADSAEAVFMMGGSLRAEVGTRGSDNLSFACSPDGSAVNESLNFSAATGIATCFKRAGFADGLSFNAGTDILSADESGSWTPNLGATTGGPVSHSVQTGKYYRTGSECFAAFRCQISAKNGISGNITISGLPFPCASGTEFQTGGRAGFIAGAALSAGEKIRVAASPGTSNIILLIFGGTGGTANAGDAKITGSFHIRCGILYRI
jgi:hypothetical protein